jgi:Carboxypeptidase regulatory-like domain
MKHVLWILLVVCSITVFGGFAEPTNAQVSNGSISGTVTDAQGAGVADAAVKVTHKETNQETQTTSDSSGLFRLNLLQPGEYRLEITKPGFNKVAFDSVVVSVGADRGLGAIKLEIGQVTSTVEVTSAAPLLESTEAQITNSFTSESLTTFPGILENQGLDNLALTVPGVVNNRDLGFSNTNGTGFAVNGLRGRNNDQQIDGQNNNDNSVAGPGLFLSDPEFVAEYQITTSNFSAEYGRNSGSVVNIVTKSGSNNFHGSVYGTESNSALNALSNVQKETTASGFEGLTKPSRFNDEFTGATIGGPVWKDHLFFFGGFDDEIVSQNQLYGTGLSTPTPAGIATMVGCYGSTPSLQALQKFGPYGITGGNPQPQGTPQLVDLTGCPGVEFSGVQRTLPTGSKSYNFPIRLDLQTAKNHFFGRYLYNKSTFFNNDSFLTAAAGYPVNVPALSQDYGFSWVRTISSRMSNEFRASYGRLNVGFGGNSIGNTVPIAQQVDQALARVTFSDSSLLPFGPATNAPQGRIVNTYQFQDNWSYYRGRHSLKAGVNFTYQRSPNAFLPNINAAYRFTDWGTFGLDTPNRIQVAQGNPELDFREKDTFVYFGDDIKVKKNLTLNLGLTWSYYGQPANLFHTITEKNQSGSNPLWNPAVPSSATIFPTIPAPKNSWGPSVGFAWTPDNALMGHDGKTVLRGGYRLSYDPPFYNIYLNISSSAPIVFLQTLSAASTPIGTHNLLANPIGPNNRADLAPALVRGVFDPRTFNDTSITPNFGPEKTHEWSLGLQRQVFSGAVFEARYVGNHALDLFQSINGNPNIAGLLADFPNLVPAGLTPCTTPTTILGPGQTKHPELGRVDCNQGIVRQRTNTAYSDYNALQLELRGNQIRHQLTLRAGYTFSKTTDNASEIFATFGAGNSQTFSQSQVNFTGTEHGNSGLDFPHTFFVAFTEELPMFRAQHGIIGHILGGWAVAGSYYISSGQPYTPVQFALNGGGPDYDNAFVGAFYGTVDQALRPFAANPAAPVNQVGIYAGDILGCDNVATACPTGITPTTLISLNQFNIDGSAKPVTSKDVRFIANTATANTVFNSPFGNVGRNTLRDSWTNIGNFTLFKSVTIRENLKAQFHATMQNVFNHPNYFSIDPFLDDAGLHAETLGFADPTVFSGGLQNGTVGNPGRKIAFGLTIRF